MEYWHIGSVLQDVIDLLQPQFEKGEIRLTLEIPQELPKVLMEKDHIQQVFFNLLLNAIEAMENQDHGRQIWIEALDQGDTLVVRVEDSGPGIPEDLRERIFEPFMSSKQNGTGLGLSVSYGVIEAHKGKLELIPSQHENGACFEIRLPARKQYAESQDPDR